VYIIDNAGNHNFIFRITFFMNITTEPYQESIKRLPKSGQHILASQTDNDIIVYQAYKPGIAHFAVENQYLGGPEFSLSRMSWIKPNFLWMMYRCGWAEKENQEHRTGHYH